MVIFFGPAGAGKSVQGQILAARHGWRWLSAGQLLRDTRDPHLLQQMSTGELISTELVNRVMADALTRAKDVKHVVFDGFPRQLDQARWLVDSQLHHKRTVGVVFVLEVPQEELLRRLQIRGRMDDTKEAIEERISIYKREVAPILDYFKKLHIPVVHVDGMGTVGEVHDRIESELEICKLV